MGRDGVVRGRGGVGSTSNMLQSNDARGRTTSVGLSLALVGSPADVADAGGDSGSINSTGRSTRPGRGGAARGSSGGGGTGADAGPTGGAETAGALGAGDANAPRIEAATSCEMLSRSNIWVLGRSARLDTGGAEAAGGAGGEEGGAVEVEAGEVVGTAAAESRLAGAGDGAAGETTNLDESERA